MLPHHLQLLRGSLLVVVLAAGSACRHQATTDESAAAPRAAQPTRPTMQEDTEDRATELATLAAGCFWCIEAVLERVDGVVDVQSGYMGGSTEQPTYDDVCTGRTGHAEVVQLRFDPGRLPFARLLEWFFQAHDPTTLNQQGPDHGTHYRSAIFYHNEQQRQIAEQAMAAAASSHAQAIVTEISAASTFWPAEPYHQDFFAKNPTHGYCRAWIPPKLKKLGLDEQPK